MLNLYEKCTKKRCFFGPSIWRVFWKGLGRVLGGQNPRFLLFFQCFFEVVFEARFGRRKNRAKKPKKAQKAIFLSWAPVIPRPVGRDIERGNTKISESLVVEFRCWCLVFDVEVDDISLARRAPPSVGGGLKTPWGGHRRPPTLGSRR